jgi:acyl-CoA thioesterase-1
MLQIISARRRFLRLAATTAVLAAMGCGCGQGPTPPSLPPPATVAAPTETEPVVRIVVLGDSLAAGLGLAEAEAFPAVVESLLRGDGFDVRVVNAGVSGDTTAGGLSRVDWVLQQPAEILVVELGGNDALRGQPLENTEKNLREIVRRGRTTGAAVVLLGMDVPTNYGPDYATAFAGLYPRIAEEEGAILVPGFVRELGADPTLLQPDGLHPTAEGQRRLAERLLPTLTGVLEELRPSD